MSTRLFVVMIKQLKQKDIYKIIHNVSLSVRMSVSVRISFEQHTHDRFKITVCGTELLQLLLASVRR